MELIEIKKDLTQVREAVLNGEADALEVYQEASKILNEFKKLTEAIKGHAKDVASLFHKDELREKGIELRSGGARLQYQDDPIYAEIKQQLKDREELLKAASKSKDVIFDSNGIEVPKVSTKYTADSLVIK